MVEMVRQMFWVSVGGPGSLNGWKVGVGKEVIQQFIRSTENNITFKKFTKGSEFFQCFQ